MMAAKKFAEFVNESSMAKVYWNAQDAEYRVRFYKDGVLRPDADYFTDCRLDALSTAQHAVNRGVS